MHLYISIPLSSETLSRVTCYVQKTFSTANIANIHGQSYSVRMQIILNSKSEGTELQSSSLVVWPQ